MKKIIILITVILVTSLLFGCDNSTNSETSFEEIFPSLDKMPTTDLYLDLDTLDFTGYSLSYGIHKTDNPDALIAFKELLKKYEFAVLYKWPLNYDYPLEGTMSNLYSGRNVYKLLESGKDENGNIIYQYNYALFYAIWDNYIYLAPVTTISTNYGDYFVYKHYRSTDTIDSSQIVDDIMNIIDEFG